MDLSHLERKLLAAGRTEIYPEAVPRAFEKRVLANLGRGSPVDPWETWARAMWRAAGLCSAPALLLAAWTAVDFASGGSGTDLVEDFEATLLAAAEHATLVAPPE